jgi:hypothetical protein
MTGGRRRVALFGGWALVGAGGTLGVLTPLSIGPFVLVVVAGATVALALKAGGGPELVGLLTGAGIVPLYVAWLNRAGPGEVCRPLGGGGQDCMDEWSPWPWLVVGVGLFVAGVLLYRSLTPRRPPAPSTGV